MRIRRPFLFAPLTVALSVTVAALLSSARVCPATAGGENRWRELGTPMAQGGSMLWDESTRSFVLPGLVSPNTTFWRLEPDSGWRTLDAPPPGPFAIYPFNDGVFARVIVGTYWPPLDTTLVMRALRVASPTAWESLGTIPIRHWRFNGWVPDLNGEYLGVLEDGSSTGYRTDSLVLWTWKLGDPPDFIRRRVLPPVAWPTAGNLSLLVDVRHARVLWISPGQDCSEQIVYTTSVAGDDGWHRDAATGDAPAECLHANVVADPVRGRMLLYSLGDPDGTPKSRLWAYRPGDPGSWERLVELPLRMRDAAVGIAHDTLWASVLPDPQYPGGTRTVAIPLAAPDRWSTVLESDWPAQNLFAGVLRDDMHDRWLWLAGWGSRYSDTYRTPTLDTLWALSLHGESAAWSRVAAGGAAPAPRVAAAFAFDAATRTGWMYGGFDRSLARSSYFSDLWALHLEDTPRWEQFPSTAAGRVPDDGRHLLPAFVFDPVGRQLVLFASGSDTIWTLGVDGPGAWIPRLASGAPPQGWVDGSSAVYDPSHDRIVFDVVWTPDGRPWALTLRPALAWIAGAPLQVDGLSWPSGGGARGLFDPVGERVLEVGGYSSLEGLPYGVLTIDAGGDSPGAPVPLRYRTGVPAFAPAAAIYDPASDAVLAFGDLNGEPRLQRLEFARGAQVPTLALGASVAADAIALRWSGAPHASFALSRRAERDAAWARIATLVADAAGGVTYADRAIEPGTRYGYRLALASAPGTLVTADQWVSAASSATAFALSRAWPNPAHGPMTVAFTLAAGGPVTLALFDVAGRRVGEQRLGVLAAGPHAVSFAAPSGGRTGLYLLRLTQGGQHRTARVVFVR